MTDVLVKKDIDQSELFKNQRGPKENHGGDFPVNPVVPKNSVSHPEVHTLLCKLQQQSEVIVKLYQCYPQCNVIMLLNA